MFYQEYARILSSASLISSAVAVSKVAVSTESMRKTSSTEFATG